MIVACTMGCAPATIYRTDGPPLEAVIEDSDATTLRVRDEAGQRYALGQTQVSDIDHPGDRHFLAGIIITAMGAIILRQALSDDAGPLAAGMGRLMGGMFVVTGGISFGVGGPTWLRSRRAAGPFNEARPAKIPRRYREPPAAH